MDRRKNTEEINQQVQSAVAPLAEVLFELKSNLKELIATQQISHKNIEEKLEALIIQTTKTNGRVNLLELWRANSEGKMAIIFITVGIGISIITAFLTKKII